MEVAIWGCELGVRLEKTTVVVVQRDRIALGVNGVVGNLTFVFEAEGGVLEEEKLLGIYSEQFVNSQLDKALVETT